MLIRLKEQFPDKTLDPGSMKTMNFTAWKLADLKKFNNKTCTSKKQKWSVPSKRQQSLHSPETLSNIGINKPCANRVFSSSKTKKQKITNNFDPRAPQDQTHKPITETEIDILADITNGNSGIVCLLRTPASENTYMENLNHPASFETVESSEHIEVPKSLVNMSMQEIDSFNHYLPRLLPLIEGKET